MSSPDFYKQSTLPSLPPRKEKGPPPPHIGPYKIESLLKQGSLGTLYLGLDPETSKPVVVKTLAPDLISSKEMVQQFLKEAEVIRLTDHPNIIKLRGQGEWEHGLYIATEFAQGVPLLQFIEQQTLSPAGSIDIALQVAYALLHLHTHGVIHRDLKPENIIITDDGHAKVIDFGIAQLSFDKKRGLQGGAGRIIGTPSYMSPEQRKDPSKANEQSDIYSLGIIMYELMTGRVCDGKIELSKLPKKLRPLISKAISRLPEDRYPDIVDFIQALSDYRFSDESLMDKRVLDEAISETYQRFLPTTLPDWPQFDIGLAYSEGASTLNVYYDFLKFADGSYLILLAESKYDPAQALAFVGLIKGMTRTLTRPYSLVSTERFDPMECISSLNDLIAESHVAKPMAMSLLYLCPINDEFSLISCGFQSLWHISKGSNAPHVLDSQNPLLGERTGQDFFEITDNWDDGDTLFLHSFNTKLYDTLEIEHIDTHLEEVIPPLLQKSAHAQAKGVLTALSREAQDLADHAPKVVLALQRIT